MSLPKGDIDRFAARKGFVLDAFQEESCSILDDGQSIVVSAPTSAGKTVVAEYAIERVLQGDGRIFYTTPIKALSNQKYRDLSLEFGPHRVGLLTGDTSIRPGADIVVMTTEVLRNMLYTQSAALIGLECVVLDEVHYLMDPFRGPVWEEVMIHLGADVQMVCLSATVSNADELAAWLSEIHGPTAVVVEHHRPVPLHHEVLLKDRRSKHTSSVPVLVNRRANRRLEEMFEGRRRYSAPRRVPVVRFLRKNKMLPAIYFLFSRRGCDEAARACSEAGIHLTSHSEAERIREILAERAAGLSTTDRAALDWDSWSELIEAGIAAHHAGLVPLIKEAVEEAFSEGLIKVVFATETLAMGVNLPAKTVVLEQLSRFRGEGHVPLTAADYTQLTGRAGRRGIDDQGEALIVWSPYLQFDHIVELATTDEYPLESAFRPNYNMVVNLLLRSSRDEAHEVLGRSFAQFRGRKRLQKVRRRLEKARRELAEREQDCSPEVWAAVEDLLAGGSRSDATLGRTHGVLADLRPGDIITGTDAGEPAVAVLSATRRNRGYRLKVVDASGNLRTLQAEDFTVVPHLIGGVAIDYPFNPNDVDTQADVAEHLRDLGHGQRASSAHRHARILLKARQRVRDLEVREAALGTDLVRAFDAIVEILRERGYLDGDVVTDKGKTLTRIYHEADLLMCEAIFNGLLDGLDAAETAGLVSCLCFRARGNDESEPYFPSQLLEKRFRSIAKLQRGMNTRERSAGVAETNAPDAGFMAIAHGWALGGEVSDVLLDETMAGGDFVRTMKILIDVLRQIGSVAPEPVASTARSSAAALDRGLVLAVGSVEDELDESSEDESGDEERVGDEPGSSL